MATYDPSKIANLLNVKPATIVYVGEGEGGEQFSIDNIRKNGLVLDKHGHDKNSDERALPTFENPTVISSVINSFSKRGETEGTRGILKTNNVDENTSLSVIKFPDGKLKISSTFPTIFEGDVILVNILVDARWMSSKGYWSEDAMGPLVQDESQLRFVGDVRVRLDDDDKLVRAQLKNEHNSGLDVWKGVCTKHLLYVPSADDEATNNTFSKLPKATCTKLVGVYNPKKRPESSSSSGEVKTAIARVEFG